MNANRKLIYYPLILFIFIFLADKLALIPVLQRYGRKESTSSENIQMALEQNRRSRARKKTDGLDVAILGTSRSEMFYSLHPSVIKNNKYISHQGEKRLLQSDFDTVGIFRASEILTHFLNFHVILRSSRRPDLILLEIGPEMFNSESPVGMNRTIKEIVIPPALLPALIGITRGSRRQEFLYRLLFPSYALRFRPEKILANYFSGVDYKEASELPVSIIKAHARVRPIPRGYREFHEKRIPLAQYNHYFKKYGNTILTKTFLRNYKYDRDEFRMLAALLLKARRAKLPIVVWMPPVHEFLEQGTRKTGYYRHHAAIRKLIQEANIPFWDGRRDFRSPCRYFVDCSHFSGRCAPWFMDQLLSTALKRYPRLKSRLRQNREHSR